MYYTYEGGIVKTALLGIGTETDQRTDGRNTETGTVGRY